MNAFACWTIASLIWAISWAFFPALGVVGTVIIPFAIIAQIDDDGETDKTKTK